MLLLLSRIFFFPSSSPEDYCSLTRFNSTSTRFTAPSQGLLQAKGFVHANKSSSLLKFISVTTDCLKWNITNNIQIRRWWPAVPLGPQAVPLGWGISPSKEMATSQEHAASPGWHAASPGWQAASPGNTLLLQEWWLLHGHGDTIKCCKETSRTQYLGRWRNPATAGAQRLNCCVKLFK